MSTNFVHDSKKGKLPSSLCPSAPLLSSLDQFVCSDDPAWLQYLARHQVRQRGLKIRRHVVDFNQARRKANAVAALLEMEG